MAERALRTQRNAFAWFAYGTALAIGLGYFLTLNTSANVLALGGMFWHAAWAAANVLAGAAGIGALWRGSRFHVLGAWFYIEQIGAALLFLANAYYAVALWVANPGISVLHTKQLVVGAALGGLARWWQIRRDRTEYRTRTEAARVHR